VQAGAGSEEIEGRGPKERLGISVGEHQQERPTIGQGLREGEDNVKQPARDGTGWDSGKYKS